MTENKDSQFNMTGEEYEAMLAEWGERTTTIRSDLNAKFEKLKLTINPYFNPEFDAVCKAIKENDTRVRFLTKALKNAHITDAAKTAEEKDDEEVKAAHIRRIGSLIKAYKQKKILAEVAEIKRQAEAEEKRKEEAEEERPKLIPYCDRPYFWALREMKDLFDNPKTIRLTATEPFGMSSSCHVSLYHVDDPNMPDILRQYWVRSDYIMFKVINNFDELYRFHPEIVDTLIANGVAEYENAVKRMYASSNKRHLLVVPHTFYPYRLEDD